MKILRELMHVIFARVATRSLYVAAQEGGFRSPHFLPLHFMHTYRTTFGAIGFSPLCLTPHCSQRGCWHSLQRCAKWPSLSRVLKALVHSCFLHFEHTGPQYREIQSEMLLGYIEKGMRSRWETKQLNQPGPETRNSFRKRNHGPGMCPCILGCAMDVCEWAEYLGSHPRLRHGLFSISISEYH